MDFILILFTLILSTIGVLAITSSNESLRNKQIIGIVVSLVIMFLFSMIDYHRLIDLYWFGYIVSLALLMIVILKGHDSHGASRWIQIGGFTFQPSEITKIMLILFFAKFIMKYRDRIRSISFVMLCVLLLAPPVFLVLKQPDLSTSIMLLVIFTSILFVGGMDRRLLTTVMMVVVPLSILVIVSASWKNSPFLKLYQQKRILSWLHPEDYPEDAYQTLNSMMAIGSGQFSGKGLHTNEINSVLNSGYISESSTDFIFTVIGEELGFLGSILVVLLLLAIVLKCLYIARRSRDFSGMLIAVGVAAWLGFQGFLNIGVATGVIPNTGIPLPFVSSGLTSLVCEFAGIGCVLNVAMQGKKFYR
ncbi:MAG: rod shape-determining protein RodA [Lachnospiraceae bacterium]|nr:rod shape-determining protein RodA [Lachnospiraceae bacterium]MBF1000486.1 rod shape-determining protein RodA [Lachnospiraceae bacterium]MBF1003355.1 rod shape-determining protein RodA [Lachnospiraceae bacterium]MBF1011695.1 rod shape-determining protein RodA [Lachnospiraceae bacterium]